MVFTFFKRLLACRKRGIIKNVSKGRKAWYYGLGISCLKIIVLKNWTETYVTPIYIMVKDSMLKLGAWKILILLNFFFFFLNCL